MKREGTVFGYNINAPHLHSHPNKWPPKKHLYIPSAWTRSFAFELNTETVVPQRPHAMGECLLCACPARVLRATFIMTFPDSVPKFTITQ